MISKTQLVWENKLVWLHSKVSYIAVGTIPFRVIVKLFCSFCTEDQNRQTGTGAILHTVVLRLGALLVLMLTVGDWSDVLHILITFLGEAVCLLPSQDLLKAALKVCVNQLLHSVILPISFMRSSWRFNYMTIYSSHMCYLLGMLTNMKMVVDIIVTLHFQEGEDTSLSKSGHKIREHTWKTSSADTWWCLKSNSKTSDYL